MNNMEKEYLKKIKSLSEEQLKIIAKKYFDFKFFIREDFESNSEYLEQFREFKKVLSGKTSFEDFVANIFSEGCEDGSYPTMKDYLNAYSYILSIGDK